MLEDGEICEATQSRFFVEEVEGNFNKCLRAHELKLENSPQSSVLHNLSNLEKDFLFLLNIGYLKQLMRKNQGQSMLALTPKDYVLRIAKDIFTTYNASTKSLEKLLDQRIEQIQRTQSIPLDYAFYEGVEPPSIAIYEDEMKFLFPDPFPENIEQRSSNIVYAEKWEAKWTGLSPTCF